MYGLSWTSFWAPLFLCRSLQQYKGGCEYLCDSQLIQMSWCHDLPFIKAVQTCHSCCPFNFSPNPITCTFSMWCCKETPLGVHNKLTFMIEQTDTIFAAFIMWGSTNREIVNLTSNISFYQKESCKVCSETNAQLHCHILLSYLTTKLVCCVISFCEEDATNGWRAAWALFELKPFTSSCMMKEQ